LAKFITSEITATATFNKDEKRSVVGLMLKTRMGIIDARRLPVASP
jgi:hypothetical protein